MGRRKNNPSLVSELIDGLWSMDQNEFEEKYNSLSSSDMSKVSDAIDGMEQDIDDRLFGDDNCDDESLSIDEAVDIWLSNGKDEDYTCGFSEDELEREARKR